MAFEIETVESRIHDTWTEFKKYIDGTYMSLAFQYYDDGQFYQIVAEPYGGISHRYFLLQDAGADDVDFTTNFQPLAFRKAGSFETVTVFGGAADGATPVGNPVLVAGYDGTNVQTLLTDSTGRQIIVGAGVAGAPAGGVVSIQGVSGGSAIPVTGTFTPTVDTYSQSAFGEQRIAANYTLADLINKYELDTTEFSTSTATGGTVTHIPAQSAVSLAVTASSGSTARLRTNTFYRYQAGKGLLIKQTVYHADAGQTNQVRRWGFFDDNDGLFWQLSGTTFSVVRRTSTSGAPVETTVVKASFNNDILDGTGPSGINLDLTKGNIFEIKFQWLGVGTVKFFVNGYLVHTMAHANTLAVPYMKTAQLPIGFDVVNTGASAISSMISVCSSVIAEGGELPPQFSYAAYNTTPIVVTTTERPVLTIRPKATYNSIENRMLILPTMLSISTEGARLSFRLVFNGTLTGASYTSVGSASGTEFDVAATAISGGDTLYFGFLGNANDATRIDLSELFGMLERKLRRNGFTSTTDTLTVMAFNELSGSTNVRAALTFNEIR